MGNDKRKYDLNISNERNRKKTDSVKKEQEFLDELKKLITDWAKNFPNDTGTNQTLQKLFKKVEFEGVSKDSENKLSKFQSKFRQKVR